MAITDELRLFAADPYTGWVPTDKQQADLRAIADRIDAEHESACVEAYGNGVMSVPIALDESAWFELPKDADGVPIHIGDYLHCDETGRDFPCRGYCCSVGKNGERRWTVECSYDAYSGTSEYVSARRCRHRHDPTVEDVLREFADRYLDYEGIPSAGRRGVGEALMDEYAKQLRLAEENK